MINKIDINKIKIHIINKSELDDLLTFQKNIINNMSKKEWFTSLTKEEFLTPIIGRDNAYFFTYDNLVIGLLVLTCDIPEVLEEYQLPKGNYILIDSIMVKEEFRGNNLQRKMLEFAYKRAKELNMDGLVATIHPDNIYSLNNFIVEEYSIIHELNIHGGPRYIVVKNINK